MRDLNTRKGSGCVYQLEGVAWSPKSPGAGALGLAIPRDKWQRWGGQGQLWASICWTREGALASGVLLSWCVESWGNPWIPVL